MAEEAPPGRRWPPDGGAGRRERPGASEGQPLIHGAAAGRGQSSRLFAAAAGITVGLAAFAGALLLLTGAASPDMAAAAVPARAAVMPSALIGLQSQWWSPPPTPAPAPNPWWPPPTTTQKPAGTTAAPTSSPAETAVPTQATLGCSSYRCPPGFCPKRPAPGAAPPAGLTDEHCCEGILPCKASSPFCEAHRLCQTTTEYCKPLMSKHLEKVRKGFKDLIEASPLPINVSPDARFLATTDPLATSEPFGSEWQGVRDKLLAKMAGMADAAKRAQAVLVPPENETVVRVPGEDLLAQIENMTERDRMFQYGVSVGCIGASSVVGYGNDCVNYYKESTFVMHARGHHPVMAVAVLPDTLHAVSCGHDGLCWVWNIADASPQQVFVGHRGPVYTVSVMSNNDYVFSGGAASHNGSSLGEGWVWNWRDGTPKAKFVSPKGSFLASTNIMGRQEVAVGTVGNGPFILNWASSSLGNLLLPAGQTTAVAYVPSMVRFVSGHEDGTIRYWNAYSGELLRVIRAHQGPVNALAASPTRQEAWSAGEDGTIKLWDLKEDFPVKFFSQEFDGPIYALALIPGGEVVVSGDWAGTVRFWERQTGFLNCKIDSNLGAVRSIAVNPSNQMGQLLTAHDNGVVQVWQTR